MINLFKFLTPSVGNKRTTIGTTTSESIRLEWVNISLLLKGKQPSQMRQALISADKALDNALRDVVDGDSMGERLKNAKNKFDYGLYQKIWAAHKMRNSLVHESGYEPPYHMIEQSINTLKNGLESLGVSGL